MSLAAWWALHEGLGGGGGGFGLEQDGEDFAGDRHADYFSPRRNALVVISPRPSRTQGVAPKLGRNDVWPTRLDRFLRGVL